jgi:phosphate transport system permease protein
MAMIDLKKLRDWTGLYLSWLASSITIAVCLGIIAFLCIKGFSQVNYNFLVTPPNPSMNQSMSGGISTPIIGTILLTLTGMLFAVPWGLATAIYLSEYGGGRNMIKIFRLAIDVLASVPTIVIAIFGMAIFSLPQFGFLSSMVQGVEGVNRAYGRSFLVAGLTMAVMILPIIVRIFEEAIGAVPVNYRESALALGASKWQSITTVVLPSARGGIITGIILGMGRIIGDTAIVWLALGGTLRMTGIQPWWTPVNWLSTLQNTGSTLTTYVFYASPAGEGNMPEKAFGAAFVLIIIIIFLNLFTDLLGRIGYSVKEN